MRESAVRRGSDPVQAVTQTLRRACPKIERILLFGSRAQGGAQPRSDIDLAVSCPQATQREWLDLCDAVETAPTLLRIDLVRLETAGAALRDRILREGRILYERGSNRARD
jgi:predicted nucleotidyltransferase